MTAYNYACDWKSGFVMDPTKKQRTGYILDFDGIGLAKPLDKNITVYMPYNADKDPAYTGLKITKGDKTKPTPTVDCVAVLENWSWAGGVGDPICFSFYVAAETANLLKSQQQMSLKTTSIKALSWWIAKFDEETKQWFEECYPLSDKTVTCQLNAHGETDTRLHVADTATKIMPTIDVNVYQVYMEIVPAAQQMFTIQVATSPSTKVAVSYGLVVGKQAGAALKPA
jgi:hypothetical protein